MKTNIGKNGVRLFNSDSTKCRFAFLSRARGFSLLEILVVLGLMSIISLGVASLMSNMHKELKSTDEKLALQSTQLLITNVLSSSTFCGCFLTRNNTLTFDYQGAQTWSGSLTDVYAAYDPVTCAPIGTSRLLQLNVPIGNSNLKPVTMSLDAITQTTPGNFTSDLNIGFDPSSLTMTRKPLSIHVYFTIKMTPPEPPNARILASCTSSAAGAGAAFDAQLHCTDVLGGIWNASAVPPTPKCEMTYH